MCTGITGDMKLGSLIRMPKKKRMITLSGLLPEKKRITVIIEFRHKHSERNSFGQINYRAVDHLKFNPGKAERIPVNAGHNHFPRTYLFAKTNHKFKPLIQAF